QFHSATFGAPGDGVTLVISRENLHDEERLRRELGGIARLIDGLGAVSVVGAGINATYRTLRQGTASLEREGIGAQGIATSSFRITWLVSGDDTARAVRALHQQFIEVAGPPVP